MRWPSKISHNRINLFLLSLIVVFSFSTFSYGGKSFKQQSGKHFIVYFDDTIDDAWAHDVLNQAEKYYDTIAETIGYARYQNFWTWDERVKIVVYANQKDFMDQTHQPSWSTGFVVRDYKLFSSRVIISYLQEQDFLTNVLPHEISHLILRDFIGFDQKIPLWFDEGIAQFFENGRREEAYKVMKLLVKNDKALPIIDLFNKDIHAEKEDWKVLQFYAQSVSVVDFLISKYGSESFGELCRSLKDGDEFEDALKKTYNPSLDSAQTLEQKWLNFIRNSSKND